MAAMPLARTLRRPPFRTNGPKLLEKLIILELRDGDPRPVEELVVTADTANYGRQDITGVSSHDWNVLVEDAKADELLSRSRAKIRAETPWDGEPFGDNHFGKLHVVDGRIESYDGRRNPYVGYLIVGPQRSKKVQEAARVVAEMSEDRFQSYGKPVRDAAARLHNELQRGEVAIPEVQALVAALKAENEMYETNIRVNDERGQYLLRAFDLQ
jgi:hypothetical protein